MNDQVTREETAEILRQAELALAAEGDFVELGCYKGATSVLLGKLLRSHDTKASPATETVLSDQISDWSIKVQYRPASKTLRKHLWIYDSFAGLPAKTPEDASGAGANFQEGELLVTKREVIDRLRKNGLKTSSRPDPSQSSVIVKKAWFDQLQPQDLPEQIAFAFCDGDLYDSIKTSLQLVAPRLAPKGIIIVHDYNNPELPGSARAVDEFLRQHSDYHLQIRRTLAIITHEC